MCHENEQKQNTLFLKSQIFKDFLQQLRQGSNWLTQQLPRHQGPIRFFSLC